MCGHPVKYTIAENIEVPDPRPHVLVVRGLPTEFQGVQQAFAMYLKNTTKTPPLSCEVHEDIATVKFRDKQRMYMNMKDIMCVYMYVIIDISIFVIYQIYNNIDSKVFFIILFMIVDR